MRWGLKNKWIPIYPFLTHEFMNTFQPFLESNPRSGSSPHCYCNCKELYEWSYYSCLIYFNHQHLKNRPSWMTKCNFQIGCSLCPSPLSPKSPPTTNFFSHPIHSHFYKLQTIKGDLVNQQRKIILRAYFRQYFSENYCHL